MKILTSLFGLSFAKRSLSTNSGLSDSSAMGLSKNRSHPLLAKQLSRRYLIPGWVIPEWSRYCYMTEPRDVLLRRGLDFRHRQVSFLKPLGDLLGLLLQRLQVGYDAIVIKNATFDLVQRSQQWLLQLAESQKELACTNNYHKPISETHMRASADDTYQNSWPNGLFCDS